VQLAQEVGLEEDKGIIIADNKNAIIPLYG
jgi:hypothetical protein